MVIKRYCFVSECYAGNLYIDTDTGEKRMEWLSDKELTDLARRYKQIFKLSNTNEIDVFISERVISDRRPDRSLWLGLNGITETSDLGIFLQGHGVSINDTFWIDEIESNKRWYDLYSKV